MPETVVPLAMFRRTVHPIQKNKKVKKANKVSVNQIFLDIVFLLSCVERATFWFLRMENTEELL